MVVVVDSGGCYSLPISVDKKIFIEFIIGVKYILRVILYIILFK